MAIAAEFSKLLDSCQEMVISHLRVLVDRMFENADVALLDFAEKAENNMAQTLFFDAMKEVREKRPIIEQQFYQAVKHSFAEFPIRPNNHKDCCNQNLAHDSLSLIDTDELETDVATKNATGKLASRIMDRIFALKQRLAVVNGGNAVEESQIPGGPAWLGTAFQDASEHMELEAKVRLVFIALFDKYVLSQADSLFDEYNKQLIQADILPNLRYEVRKQAGGIEIVEKQVSDTDIDNESESSPNPVTEEQLSPSELGDEVFGRICELMSGRRTRSNAQTSSAQTNLQPPSNDESHESGFTTTDNASPQDVSPASLRSTLVNQISSLQNSVQSSDILANDDIIENIEVDELLIERLQSTLEDEREKIFAGIDRRKLPGADTDVIELVGMMFEYMLKEENLPNLAKALLSRLHTPLLKVAVVDHSFFTNNDHPARKLLNDMTAAGIRWVEEDQADRGIFPKMKEIVDHVLMNFKEDTSVFKTVLEEFTAATEELEQRAKRVEERTNEAANGQEKLQTARAHAQSEIRRLCQERAVAHVARDFLQRIWADKLTFILLRNEKWDESESWKQAVNFAGRIIESVLPTSDDEQRNARRESLNSLQEELRAQTSTMQQPDKEKLLIALFDLQSAVVSESAIETVVPLVPAQEKEPKDDVQESRSELSAEQLEMLEELKSVPFGTWFEFQKPGKKKKRAKLSWRSTVTEKFMFVDQMGVKAAVVSMYELADCMLHGTVRIVSTEKKPFVDRALSAIYRMLDHAA